MKNTYYISFQKMNELLVVRRALKDIWAIMPSEVRAGRIE
jgi:hypothetical protein